MKGKRGRPRKFFWEELNEQDRARFIKLYQEGMMYAEMADVFDLPDWKVKKIERELVGEEKIVFVPRIRKYRRKKTEKDLWNDNYFLYVVLSTRAGRSLKEMAKAVEKSYEWMRQKKKKVKGKPGWLKNTTQERQDRENEKLVETAAKELKMKVVDLERRLFFGKRMKSGVKTETLAEMIEKYKANKEGVCQNCGRRFTRKQAGKRQFCYKSKCKRKMENIAHKKTAQKTGVMPISRKSLRTKWILQLFDKLKESSQEENERWLTVKEALRECGASPMQIRWLGQRQILTRGKHPTKRWHGKPVDVYPSSQIQVVSEVLGPRR